MGWLTLVAPATNTAYSVNMLSNELYIQKYDGRLCFLAQI